MQLVHKSYRVFLFGHRCTWNHLCVRFEWTRRGRCYPVCTLKFLKASSLPKALLHLTSFNTTTECTERLFTTIYFHLCMRLILILTKKLSKCHFRNCIRCFSPVDFMDVMDELMLLRFIHGRVGRCCSNRATV